MLMCGEQREKRGGPRRVRRRTGGLALLPVVLHTQHILGFSLLPVLLGTLEMVALSVLIPWTPH